MKAIFKKQVSLNPQEAVGLLDSLSSTERERAIEVIALEWSKMEVNTAIDWINQLDDYERSLAVPGLVEFLALDSPELASEYIVNLDGNRDNAISQIIDSWVTVDPEKSADWLMTKTLPEEQQVFIEPLLKKWLVTSPVLAKEWVLSQEEGFKKDEAIKAYAKSAASGVDGHQELLAMVQGQVKDSNVRQQALKEILVSWSRVDRAASVAYANANIPKEQIADYFHEIDAEVPLD